MKRFALPFSSFRCSMKAPRVLALVALLGGGAVAHAKTLPRPPVLVGLAYGDGFDVLGAHNGRGYLNATKSHPLFQSGTRFSLFDLSGKSESAVIGKVTRDDRLPENFYASFSHRAQNAPQKLALHGARNPQPRRVRKLSAKSRTYRRAMSQVLQSKGVRVLAPKLTQVLRVDLNGDGQSEVLLAARSGDNMGRRAFAKRGDYALAAVRYVVNGRVQTKVLDADIYTRDAMGGASAVTDFTFLSCVDIDGDGKMEIAVSSRYYEGSSVVIYSFDGRNFREVMEFGNGA